MGKDKIIIGLLLLFVITKIAMSRNAAEGFVVYNDAAQTAIVYDESEPKVIGLAARLLARDLESVTGYMPVVITDIAKAKGNVIIIGTVDSPLVKETIKDRLAPLDSIRGKWEVYMHQVVEKPFEHVDKALVICGSDRRGTAYGVFSLSEKIGVHPWYWWADVLPEKKSEIVLPSPDYVSQSPSVKYRGIFLNDEDWGLQPWAAKTFEPETGDIGPKTYAKICELLLRLKANTLWPAMHNCTRAFYHYPQNKIVADDYAIVIGSSHAEPMLRNNVDEWQKSERGEYNYLANKKEVLHYWEERVAEAAPYENIYTVGMRGIHDSGIEGNLTDAQKVAVLEEIIKNQRDLLKKHVSADVSKIPQSFIPYKEVLDIYNDGMKLPDDVTLVWPDDNYGYIRELNDTKEQLRSGRGGVYYHASYWGRPHDYLWLSTTHPALIREEMVKAWQLKSDRIWILNVGDIKPLEYNITLFMDMAYSIDSFSDSRSVKKHLERWYSDIFGPAAGEALAHIYWEYYNLAFERRPEFMGWSQTEPTTKTTFTEYNHFDYGDEAQKRIDRYEAIESRVKQIRNEIDPRLDDAYFELVYYPVVCASLINKKVLYMEKAHYYARQQRASAGDYARMSQQAFEDIIQETDYYNRQLADGKWQFMMSMKPRSLPVFEPPSAPQWKPPANDGWGMSVEGGDQEQSATDIYAGNSAQPILKFTTGSHQRYFVDLFINGITQVDWTATQLQDWIVLSQNNGLLEPAFGKRQQRLWISIDWDKVPRGESIRGLAKFTAGKVKRTVAVEVFNPAMQELADFDGFIENNGYVSMHAGNMARNIDKNNCRWEIMDGLGYSQKSIIAMPLAMKSFDNETDILANAPRAEYDFFLFSEGMPKVTISCLPTHPINNEHQVRYAVAIDDEPLQIVNIRIFGRSEEWKQNVLRNASIKQTTHEFLTVGKHTLKIYTVDPGVIVDRITIDMGGLKQSYSGPPETRVVR